MSSAQLHSNPKIFQSGQGILEVIVTIGIGTIMIMALVVLSVRTNRSSDFSKASSQASSLASEGIEIINNLKEINGTDSANKLLKLNTACTGSAGGTLSWDEIFGVGMDVSDASCASFGRIGYILEIGDLDCASSNYNCVYFGDIPGGKDSVPVDSRTYTRHVFIADTPPSLGGGSGGKSNCNTNDPSDAVNYGNDWDRIKQFTVVVSWTDSAGTHNQTQSACYQK